jgi:hypothetical protein
LRALASANCDIDRGRDHIPGEERVLPLARNSDDEDDGKVSKVTEPMKRDYFKREESLQPATTVPGKPASEISASVWRVLA